MHEFAGVFFHVNAGETDFFVFAINGDFHIAVFSNRQIVLGNLIGLGKIRVEIILAVEFAEFGNGAVGGQTGFNRVFEHFFIKHRKRPRQAQANRAHVSVWCAAEGRGAVAENLCIGF